MKNVLLVVFIALSLVNDAQSANIWVTDTTGRAGPLLSTSLPKNGNVSRWVLIAFEYARRCEPLVSYTEKRSLSVPRVVKRERLNESQTTMIVDNYSYTGISAKIEYQNGYEIGFGMSQELYEALKGPFSRLAFTAPDKNIYELPTSNFRQAFVETWKACLIRTGQM